STRPGPRKDKRPQLSLPKTLPTPPSVRDIADRITAQARAALTVVAERKPNLKSSQSLPHRKLTVRRGAPPRTETRVAAAVVADKAPGVVDARPVEAEVPTALSEVVGRVTTEGGVGSVFGSESCGRLSLRGPGRVLPSRCFFGVPESLAD
ncbi:hypothetical protein, partial [Mycolicibacterium fortuitum]|uniref:hypothetical protein n=1 Tax=Mycolicibacterium fortuitum TaxID=1766 RepID=UPI000A479130